MLDEGVAEHVRDGHLGVFRAAVVRVVHHERLIAKVRQSSSFGSDESSRDQPVLLRPSAGLHQIGRTAAHAQSQHHVAPAAVVHQLPDVDVLVGIVVPERGDPADVVVQGQHAETPADLVGRTLSQVRHEMGGVGSRTAVAENKELLVLVQHLLDAADQPGHGGLVDRVEHRLLRRHVAGDPVVHVRKDCGHLAPAGNGTCPGLPR